MPTLVLMRHGQSTWNLENRFTGFVDVPLTTRGVEEAVASGKALQEAGFKFDIVYTSTLKRAQETARLALEQMQTQPADIIARDELRERDYGGLTGLDKDETRAKYGEAQVQIWRRSYDVPPPAGQEYKGESLKDVVEKRVTPYFNTEILPKLKAGKTVLVAAHGNTVRGILVALGIHTPETIVGAEIPTGKPLVVELDEKLSVTKHGFLGA